VPSWACPVYVAAMMLLGRFVIACNLRSPHQFLRSCVVYLCLQVIRINVLITINLWITDTPHTSVYLASQCAIVIVLKLNYGLFYGRQLEKTIFLFLSCSVAQYGPALYILPDPFI